MLRLAGGTHFLVLRRTPNFPGHTVHIRPRFDEALQDWHVGDRISPVFPFEGVSVPVLAGDEVRWAVFLGPVDPGLVSKDIPPCSFLTLGIFNVLAFVASESDRDRLTSLAVRMRLSWEWWELSGPNLKAASAGPATPEQRLDRALVAPLPALPSALLPTFREYRALLATSVARTQLFAPELAPELTAFNEGLRIVLESDRLSDISKLGLLANTNAALSRLSSQCLSGTSPIAETESHFWTHSLLGIGIPSLAINRLRRFAEDVLRRASFGDRLAELRKTPPHGKDLCSLRLDDAFWSTSPLFPKPLPDSPPNGAPALPLVTYFSGRDGYHSTDLSLSVPLEVVSSCNATAWTLHTITHEISHTVIGLVLARLLPKADDDAALAATAELLAGDVPPSNLFDQVRSFATFSLLTMDLSRTDKLVVSPSVLTRALRDRLPHLNEVMTHVFDFLYFYRKDAEGYVRSAWASWAVIPNIQSRIPEYLVRSLCALHASDLRRETKDEVTLDRLENCLRSTKSEFPDARLIDWALQYLLGNRNDLKKHLQQRTAPIRFVRFLLYSEHLERELTKGDVLLRTGSGGAYELVASHFDENRVENPITFVEWACRDKGGDEKRAAWVLHKLAFADSR